jgi:hypothetical protein
MKWTAKGMRGKGRKKLEEKKKDKRKEEDEG